MESKAPINTRLFADFIGGEIVVECPPPTGMMGGIISSIYYNGTVAHINFTHDGRLAGTSVVVPHGVDLSATQLTLYTAQDEQKADPDKGLRVTSSTATGISGGGGAF